MGFPGYMPVDTVDETAQFTDMAGSATIVNQVTGRPGLKENPARSLVVLWFVILAAYWFIGWFFRGQRS
jgi:hypothetical protein